MFQLYARKNKLHLIHVINKSHESRTLEQTKVHFNEFVANVLCENVGMIIFDLQGCGGCQRPKTSYLGSHFGTSPQRSVHPSAPVLLTKDSQRIFLSYDSQPPYLKFQNQGRRASFLVYYILKVKILLIRLERTQIVWAC